MTIQKFLGRPLVAACMASLLAISGHAGVIEDVAPVPVDLPGTSSFAGWNQLTAFRLPGYTFAAWPSPIVPNVDGSVAGPVLNRTSGNAYPATVGIYDIGFSADLNVKGSSLVVDVLEALADLETIVFQIEIGEAAGYDFYDHVLPVLSFNGGSQNLEATFSTILKSVQDGIFPNPVTGEDEPVYINLYALQWDLRDIEVPVTSFQISWTTAQHSQTYAMQLNQGNTFAPIPEPATCLLTGLGLSIAGLMARRRRAL